MKKNYLIFLLASMVIIFGSNFFVEDDVPQEKSLNTNNSVKSNSEYQVSENPLVVTEDIPEISETFQNESIRFSTPLFDGKISKVGGYIFDVKLKRYSDAPDSNNPTKIMESGEFISNTIIKAKDIGIPKEINFNYKNSTINLLAGARQFNLTSKFGSITIQKSFLFNSDSYGIEQQIVVSNKSNSNLVFRVFEESVGQVDAAEHNVMGYFLDEDMEKVDSPPSETEKVIGDIDWYGFSKKYFLASNILSNTGEKALKYSKHSKSSIRSVLSYKTINLMPGASYSTSSTIFLGPKDPEVLEKFGKNFATAHDLGWFGWLAGPLEKLLKMSYGFVNNYGIAIIFITLLIRIIFLPLTIKSMMSMKKMQSKMALMKPKLDAVKEQYKDDKTTQNSEIMKLYSKEGVNPLSSLSGCLPMLVQIPVFVALYNVLLYSLDLRHSEFLWISDLSSPEMLFDIPGTGIPFRVLPLVMGISWFLTQKLTPPNPGADEFQTKIFQYMPIMFTIMFWGLPSGLILYWTISNVISIFQQLYINKKFEKMQGA
ncbi:membrane protein insertase YidC [bacterium]|jgi:YidC/Oxa1 family membrane protein insertase|nr:membrane protein insertase YidC [bacterium]MBT3795083.1 membrane protein insertase YidC [bacterium]MBT4633890.1 membrane protein insertase YidC [bacterium]